MAAVGTRREVTVPDIGDFVDVPVIELLVEPGQSVAEDDPLVVLESDKATMEVPAPFAGVISELKVAVEPRRRSSARTRATSSASTNGLTR